MTPLPAPLQTSTAIAAGAIYDHGAHVTSWQPAGQAEVLWMSPTAVLDTDQAIRGGIPICFPWFGSGRSGDRTPSHGFARLTAWSLTDVTEHEGVVTVTHALTDTAATRLVFPHSFRAVHTVTLGEQLDVHLSVENLGDATLNYEAALHTYLSVGDVEHVSINGLDSVPYDDKVAGGTVRTQRGPVEFTGETDRIYLSGTGVDVIDIAGARVIHVRLVNCADTVIWNPWIERAAALPDFYDDAWRRMVCVEGANVLGNAVHLAPGEIHTMGYQLSVSPLS